MADSLRQVTERLTVLTVHAHPDDEASKGAPTLARYADEGVHTVLVCCTGGEEGDLQNPSLREEGQPFHGLTPEEEKRLVGVDACRRVGRVGQDHRLRRGRDARATATRAWPTPSRTTHPDCFHQADIDEATGRLVAIIRRTRAQVIITYGDDQAGYPHPDHLRVHDISVLAFERAGDAAWYPDLGEPFAPSKLYYSVWSKERVLAVHAGDPRTARVSRRSNRPGSIVRRRITASPPRSTSATTSGPVRTRCGRTPRRSIRPPRGGSVSTTTRWPRSTRGRTGSSPGRSSGRSPAATVSETCSPASVKRLTSMTVQYRVVVGKKDERVDGPDDADVVVTVPLVDAAAPGFDPTVAFMRGELKASGHTGQVLDLLKSGDASHGPRRPRPSPRPAARQPVIPRL